MEPDKRGPGRPRKIPVDFGMKGTDMTDTSESNRPSMRPEMRALDSRAEADRRAEEILKNFNDEAITGGDEFMAPPPPDGWSYEWKMKSVLNEENHSYQVALAQMGWTPVPLSRVPTMMPVGWKGTVVERKGMILMERPTVISDRVKMLERQKAKDQIRAKEEQMNSAPQGQFSRHKADGTPLASVKKGYEPLPIPD